jgi:predicted metal-dependent phosphoesterase TrpH
MTPNNIINMALLKELDIIAITDHNSCKNVKACLDTAKETGLLVLPGMEMETSEEIHVLCLFPDILPALEFDSFVEDKLNKIKNMPDIFGRQYILDTNDEPVCEYDNLLITSTSVSFDDIFRIVYGYGGAAIPAHIDRPSNSVIYTLGAIPDIPEISYVEVSKRSNAADFLAKQNLTKKYLSVRDSDAHYLQDISERENFLEFEKKPQARDVINALRRNL